MTNEIRIAVLCNNEMAIPAMQQLHMTGCLRTVIVPQSNAVLCSLLKQMLSGSGIRLLSAGKKELGSVIEKAIKEDGINNAWLMTFPYIISEAVLALLPGRFLNFHYGLLPKYRGVNPVLAQMLNGERESGITVHIVDAGIDTGPVVMQEKIPIEGQDTFGMQLHKLGMLGASMAIKLLQLCMASSNIPAVAQDESNAAYFKRPQGAELMIRWKTMNAAQVVRLINACNPWNKGAGTIIQNMGLRLLYAELSAAVTSSEAPVPGTVTSLDEKNGLMVCCSGSTAVTVSIISTDAGIFPAKKLLDLGVRIGDQFL